MLRSAKCFDPRRCCLCAAARAARQGERRLCVSHTGTCSRRVELEAAAAEAAPGSHSRRGSIMGAFTQALAAVTPPEPSPRACHRPLFPSPSLTFILPPLPQEGCSLATSSAPRKRNGCDNYPQLRPNMVSTDLLSLSCLIPSVQEIIRQMFMARIPKQKARIWILS